MRILFLCTELSGYFVNCISKLNEVDDVNIKIVYWPSIAEAPFKFMLEGIEMLNKDTSDFVTLKIVCHDFNPNVVYVAGWVDKEYLEIAKTLRSKGAICVMGLDNPWRGTPKQVLGTFLSSWIIKPYFDYLWVPGKMQYSFAKYLGYDGKHILTGLYTADLDLFSQPNKAIFDKELIYVGRFEQIKGVQVLVDAFLSLTIEERNGWTLRLIGNGSLRKKLHSRKNIIVEDFKQPYELAQATRNAGGFILPSFHEPWGVVVQEFAAAGLPLLLSEKVNSSEQFLVTDLNGYRFRARSTSSLKSILKMFFQLDKQSLKAMGSRSFVLAQELTPKKWVNQILLLNEAQKSTL